MSNNNGLINQLDKLRSELKIMVKDNQSFNHGEIVEKSKEMDEVIMSYYLTTQKQ